MKKKKIISISLSVILVFIIISLGFIGNYFHNLSLNPNTPKDIVFSTPEEASKGKG